MTRLVTLLDILGEPEWTSVVADAAEVDRLIHSADETERVWGCLLDVCRVLRANGEPAAFERLTNIPAQVGFYPLLVIGNILWLARRLGWEQRAAFECLAFARNGFDLGYDDLGLEACASALILDIQGQFQITRDPRQSFAVSELYERVARKQAARFPKEPGLRAFHPPLHVGLVVSNLVDHVVAYTKTVLHFSRYLDRERYRLSVYVTENLSARDHPQFPFGCEQYRSETVGAASIQELKDRDVPVYLASRQGSLLDSAVQLADRMAGDAVDIAVFQLGLACPIDWLVARLAPVPVKLAIHIGSTPFVPGLDATLYDNPANIERESGWGWPDGGERIRLRQGTDLDELRQQPSGSRARWNIPAAAVLIGVMSNHVDRRLSADYMQVIADTLRSHAHAWFIVFGSDALAEKLSVFTAAGVVERVRFGGRQTQAGAALKMLDIYANEFPVGGSQSVIEAMACGVPVVALRWSQAHAESAGAEAVGTPYAIETADMTAYRERLETWVVDADQRRAAGQALKRRAETLFSVKIYVSEVLGLAERMLGKKLEKQAVVMTQM